MKAKIEKDEKAVVDMQVEAAKDNEKASAKGVKAADAALKQLTSDPTKFIGAGSEAGAEAGGEAKR